MGQSQQARGKYANASPPPTPSPSPSPSQSLLQQTLTPTQRRREQNRFAQRAYRERRDRHQFELEKALSELQSKYQGLCRSYSEQGDQVRQLKALIAELHVRKAALLQGQNSSTSGGSGSSVSGSGIGRSGSYFDLTTTGGLALEPAVFDLYAMPAGESLKFS